MGGGDSTRVEGDLLPSSPPKYGWTPLYAAAHYNHPKIVHLLVDLGADINAIDKVGGQHLCC